MSQTNPNLLNTQEQLPDSLAKPVWAVRTPEELEDFFLDSNDPNMHLFSANALIIKNNMVDVAKELRSRVSGEQSLDESLTFLLPLHGGGIGPRIYKADMTEAQTSLLEGVYGLTKAEQMASVLDEDGVRRNWFRGTFEFEGREFPMNFVEVHSGDDIGDYLEWQLVTDVPEDLLDARTDSAALTAADESRQFEAAFYKELRDIKTVQIDEAQVVSDWVRHQAA